MAQITLEVAHSVAVWIEMFIFGIYTALFISALAVMLKRSGRNNGAWIFLIATLLMYTVATLHMALALFRFLRAFILLKAPAGPLAYIYDFTRWDTILDSTVYCVMTWIGDALVIYRCYYVWNKSLWVIVLPVLLLLTSIGVNIYVLWWFTHLTATVNYPASVALVEAIYPLALSQNVITTALISFKIYKQHRSSSAHGIIDRSSRLSLIRILRILVESAMLYTVQLLILIILYYAHSNGQVILQFAIVPSIGIVFVLISIRVHLAKSNTVFASALGTIPAWLEENDEAIEFSTNPSLPPGVVTLRVSNNETDDRDDYSEPFGSASYAHKRSIKSHSGDSNTL